MYFEHYFPFYATYANPMLYEGERMQEQEFELMKSYYPITVQQIQERVEEECDHLDYEGSRLYDEYPDRLMMRSLCRQIREQVAGELELQEISDRFLDDLIEVLLYQEISRRRCRRRRCRGF